MSYYLITKNTDMHALYGIIKKQLSVYIIFVSEKKKKKVIFHNINF